LHVRPSRLIRGPPRASGQIRIAPIVYFRSFVSITHIEASFHYGHDRKNILIDTTASTDSSLQPAPRHRLPTHTRYPLHSTMSSTVSRHASLLVSTIDRAARPAEDRRVSRTYAPGAMRRLTYTENAPVRPSSLTPSLLEDNARLLALLAKRDVEISSLKQEVVSCRSLPSLLWTRPLTRFPSFRNHKSAQSLSSSSATTALTPRFPPKRPRQPPSPPSST
jgi:hypothetical protein